MPHWTETEEVLLRALIAHRPKLRWHQICARFKRHGKIGARKKAERMGINNLKSYGVIDVNIAHIMRQSGKTYKQIASVFGVTPEGVAQALKNTRRYKRTYRKHKRKHNA